MHKGILVLGVLVLIAGIIIAFSNPIQSRHYERTGTRYVRNLETGEPIPGTEEPIYTWVEDTIYPYSIPGAIICLIGLVTTVIGGYMKAEAKETEQRRDYVKLDAFLEPEEVTESEKVSTPNNQHFVSGLIKASAVITIIILVLYVLRQMAPP